MEINNYISAFPADVFRALKLLPFFVLVPLKRLACVKHNHTSYLPLVEKELRHH